MHKAAFGRPLFRVQRNRPLGHRASATSSA